MLLYHFSSSMTCALQKLLQKACQRLQWLSVWANRSSAGFGGQGSDGAACIIFCIPVLSQSATNQNIFSLLEWIKFVHKILLMFAITICGVFLLQERNIKVLNKKTESSGNIIWSFSFNRCLAFLLFRSLPYTSVRRASDIALPQIF